MLHQNILIYHIDDFFEPETFAILDAPKWKKSYTLRLIDYWGLCNYLKSQFFFTLDSTYLHKYVLSLLA